LGHSVVGIHAEIIYLHMLSTVEKLTQRQPALTAMACSLYGQVH